MSDKLKMPTWVIVLAVLSCLVGGIGVINGQAEGLAAEQLNDMGGQLDDLSTQKITTTIENEDGTTETQEIDVGETLQMFKGDLEVPAWFNEWASTIGLASSITSALIVFAGLSLLTLRPFALRIFFNVMLVSIIWGAARVYLYLQLDHLMAFAFVMKAGMSVFIDVVFLFTLLSNDRGVFYGRPSKNDEQDKSENKRMVAALESDPEEFKA